MAIKVSAFTAKEKYRTVITSDSHNFVVDEPLNVGGKDLGPAPGQLLAAAIASCSAITIKLYAERKGWKLDRVSIDAAFERNAEQNKTIFTKTVHLEGDLESAQRERLLEIGKKCPVHKILTGEIEINSQLI